MGIINKNKDGKMNILKISEESHLEYFYDPKTLLHSELFINEEKVGSFFFYLGKVHKDAYLESFLIEEKYLNKGYGLILAQGVKLLAEEINTDSLFLHANPYNHSRKNKDELVSFYEKHLNMNIVADEGDKGYYMCADIF